MLKTSWQICKNEFGQIKGVFIVANWISFAGYIYKQSFWKIALSAPKSATKTQKNCFRIIGPSVFGNDISAATYPGNSVPANTTDNFRIPTYCRETIISRRSNIKPFRTDHSAPFCCFSSLKPCRKILPESGSSFSGKSLPETIRKQLTGNSFSAQKQLLIGTIKFMPIKIT